MRLLVTGGVGFIGSHVCAKFAAAGMATTAYDAFRYELATDHPSGGDALRYRVDTLLTNSQVVVGDLTDRDCLRETLKDVRPDCVIHLAGLALADVAERDPILANRDILQSTITLLEEVRALGLARFVYVSSSMVYGDFDGLEVDEQCPTRPINIYGGLKLGGEILALSYLARTSTEVVIVRPSAVYGPGGHGGRVVQKFCEQALTKKTIVVSNENAMFDFTYIEDIVHGLWLAATEAGAANQVFNMTLGKSRSLMNLAECVKAYLPDAKILTNSNGFPVLPKRGTLNSNKAKDLLGFSPTVELETGVLRYIAHLREARPPCDPPRQVA